MQPHPAGEHFVEFKYQPTSFRYGAAGSLAGVLVVGLMLTTSAIRRGSAAA